MRRREIEITVGPAPADRRGFEGWALAPRPIDDFGWRFEAAAMTGIAEWREVPAEAGCCRGYLVRAADPAAGFSLRYVFAEDDAAAPPAGFWGVSANRHTTAGADLAAYVQEVVGAATGPADAIDRLARDAAEKFAYGHVTEKFNAGLAEVPAVLEGARGSCVDINTYLLAAARSAGLGGQYVSGYWFHPEKTVTEDMHCWLVFAPEGRLVFWDVAHGLKWAETLGAAVGPGLNPAGGRRVAMGCGRGLQFDTPAGLATISHFAEPMWLAEGPGRARKARPSLMIVVEDPDGDRTQPDPSQTFVAEAAS